ncbi:MAG: glycosyltransferase [Pirellulales bacterium]
MAAVRVAEPRGLLLFRRDYQGFSGGHLKVWHYYCHAMRSARFSPRIHLTPQSIADPSSPWRDLDPPPLPQWRPAEAAALFVAGLDWEAVPDGLPVPVVNLIQGVRHADPTDPRFRFLTRPALRICVSPDVAHAITATGLVNGPVHTIAGALDTAALPPPAPVRDIPLLVAGAKQPELARTVGDRLRTRGLVVDCRDTPMPRAEFLPLLARAEVAVLLPLQREGLFLPALEAMALGALVVCPDCIGNRSFCRDQVTSLVPSHDPDAIVGAAFEAVSLAAERRQALRQAAAAEVEHHGLEDECRRFLRILDTLPASPPSTVGQGRRRE